MEAEDKILVIDVPDINSAVPVPVDCSSRLVLWLVTYTITMSWKSRSWILLTFSLCSMLRFSYAEVYMNKWAVHVKGDLEQAERIASKHGFKCSGQVSYTTTSYLVVYRLYISDSVYIC